MVCLYLTQFQGCDRNQGQEDNYYPDAYDIFSFGLDVDLDMVFNLGVDFEPCSIDMN
jgi:hypothetical protein